MASPSATVVGHLGEETTMSKRNRGRLAERQMPEPVDADPEDVMRDVVRTPPTKREDWRYLQED